MEIDPELQQAIDFHGHLCPGLLIGYRAARAAMERFAVKKAYDEELVCVVENSSCSVDAVQSLTGCTFGKGNLVFKDFGKQVFTFALRKAPQAGLRISLRPDAIPPPAAESGGPQERRRMAMESLLSAAAEELFYIDEVDFQMPEEARIEPSIACANCGEPTMQSRLVDAGGKLLCVPCSQGWQPPLRD
jgi:formylmethanofuran dehydrogenase subunit E